MVMNADHAVTGGDGVGLVLRVLSNDLICASFGQADYLVGLMHSVDFHSWRTKWMPGAAIPEGRRVYSSQLFAQLARGLQQISR